ncbi:MAG: HNH endonuclease [Rickettsiales bacterium]|nr:HNH endonuclease [Rickettsiales bacterium]
MRNKFNTPHRTTAKTYTDSNGYRTYKDTGTLVHRHMAEIKLGRPLKPGEVVHHIDRNKQNNATNNLHVFANQKAHDTAHKIDANRFGASYSYTGKKKS